MVVVVVVVGEEVGPGVGPRSSGVRVVGTDVRRYPVGAHVGLTVGATVVVSTVGTVGTAVGTAVRTPTRFVPRELTGMNYNSYLSSNVRKGL